LMLGRGWPSLRRFAISGGSSSGGAGPNPQCVPSGFLLDVAQPLFVIPVRRFRGWPGEAQRCFSPRIAGRQLDPYERWVTGFSRSTGLIRAPNGRRHSRRPERFLYRSVRITRAYS
jgi:hypothetical protein